MLPLTVKLNDPRALRADSTALLGGKGASFARLKQAGLPVPEGFVVTTRAFRLVMEGALDGLSESREAREAVESSTLPADLREEITAAIASLQTTCSPQGFAVRSSAMDEDGQNASFAGQQASFLSVNGIDEVFEHIKKVWASLFKPEALIYRHEVSLESSPPQMAVVVQEMVDAATAGVCFTIDPISGSRSQVVVSAAPGLGETVVSGGAADTFYIDRTTGRVTGQDISDKTFKIEATASGPRRRTIDAEDTRRPCLETSDLARVSQIALQIEAQAGAPQDVEWAIANDGGLWVLQSRPVTTKRSAMPGSRGGASFWTNANVGEALPGVGTPLTWSIIRRFSRSGFETAFGALGLDVPEDYELVGSFTGRVYLNITQFASVMSQIPWMQPETILSLAGGPSVEAIEGGYERHSKRGFLARLPLTIPRMISSHAIMPLRGRRWARRFRKLRDAFFERDLGLLGRPELLRELDKIDALFDETGLVMIAVSSNFLSSYAVTHELLKRWGGREAASRERQLFSGLSGMRSAEPGTRDAEDGPPHPQAQEA